MTARPMTEQEFMTRARYGAGTYVDDGIVADALDEFFRSRDLHDMARAVPEHLRHSTERALDLWSELGRPDPYENAKLVWPIKRPA